MKNITQQTIARLIYAEPKVKFWNGTLKTATVSAEQDDGLRFELSVTEVHPELKKLALTARGVQFTCWDGLSGEVQAVPRQLERLANELKALAAIPVVEDSRPGDLNYVPDNDFVESEIEHACPVD